MVRDLFVVDVSGLFYAFKTFFFQNLLSPDEGKLNLLREKYSNNRPLCKSETNEVSVEAGNVVDDYATLLNDFNIELSKK